MGYNLQLTNQNIFFTILSLIKTFIFYTTQYYSHKLLDIFRSAMSAYREDEDSEESGGRTIKIPSGGRIMKQSYKIYENLLSAVAVYRTGATKNASFYKVG